MRIKELKKEITEKDIIIIIMKSLFFIELVDISHYILVCKYL